jgi:hypothetical protein
MEEVSVEFMKEADSVDGEGEMADGGGDMGRAAQEEGEKEGEMDERMEDGVIGGDGGAGEAVREINQAEKSKEG